MTRVVEEVVSQREVIENLTNAFEEQKNLTQELTTIIEKQATGNF